LELTILSLNEFINYFFLNSIVVSIVISEIASSGINGKIDYLTLVQIDHCTAVPIFIAFLPPDYKGFQEFGIIWKLDVQSA
jgi:hypothetical protein